MPSNNSFAVLLNPSSVNEVIEGLLESDIISTKNLITLKKQDFTMTDPNVMMYVRHREVKRESLINNIECHTKRCSTKFRDNYQEQIVAPKDLKTIDVEIAKTKKNLEVFKKQLVKKTESFMNRVSSLEMIEEQTESLKDMNSLGEDVSEDCFNKHLEVLENQEEETNIENKMWKPIEMRSSPVINVVARSKNYHNVEIDENGQFDPEELEMLKKCTSPISAKEKDPKKCVGELERPIQKNITTTVPNNSPALLYFTSEYRHYKNIVLSKRVLKTWKRFVSKRSFERYKKAKRIFDTITLKNVFTSWSTYVKCVKELKPEKTEGCKKKTLYVPLKLKKKVYLPSESSKEELRVPLELHKMILEPCLISDPISSQSSYHEVISTEPNAKTHAVHTAKYYKEGSNISEDSRILPNNSKLNVQELVVNDIVQNERQKKKDDTSQKKALKVDENPKLKTIEGLTKSHSSFEYRYVAQEKIITQQMAVIEKQKQIIFDLQAEHLQKQSDLGLKLVETQLAQVSANYRRKLKPVVKTGTVADSNAKLKETKKQNIHDLAERLTKSLKERQEYCKQLAERTKMRKLLIEEQKMKDKLELEEMERKKREEERRQKHLQVKMERKKAQEKLKQELTIKLEKDETIQRVTRYHNKKLLSHYFQKLRKAAEMVSEKSKACDDIYKRKLTKLFFFEWKNEIHHWVDERNQAADKYHETKLLERYWHIWLEHHREFKIRVQVSDDMFELKLQERMLRRWLAYTAKSYLRNCFKLELAGRLCRRQLLRRCLKRWRELPKQMSSERERETRCRVWRQAVQELVPDFSPVYAEPFEV